VNSLRYKKIGPSPLFLQWTHKKKLALAVICYSATEIFLFPLAKKVFNQLAA
jgi:hypothetical protein